MGVNALYWVSVEIVQGLKQSKSQTNQYACDYVLCIPEEMPWKETIACKIKIKIDGRQALANRTGHPIWRANHMEVWKQD